jgi:hypothetical protein
MDHMTSVDHMEEEEIEQMMLAIEVDIANDNV